MSKYTTEVRYIVEMNCDESAITPTEKIRSAAPKIFNFDFPIYDESHRIELEEKILKHYYTKEIGLETVGLWKLFLETKLNEIMPMYNKLYEAAAIKFNPLDEYEDNDEFSGKTTAKAIGNSKSVDRDFPQSEFDINSGGYASSSGENEDKSETSGSNDYKIIKHGRHRSGALLLKEYKDVILNIDMDIIKDLSELFMLVF